MIDLDWIYSKAMAAVRSKPAQGEYITNLDVLQLVELY